MAPLADGTIVLADGRRLAYTEWGTPEGSPVFYFHGMPGSRLWCPDESVTFSARVRLVMPDRPGIGRSDVMEGRTFSDWPADAVGLADALGIDRFAVVGVSGGGPYAASCAALIPERLTAVGIVSSRPIAKYNWAERPEAYSEWTAEDLTQFELAQEDPESAADLAAAQFATQAAEWEQHPEQIHPALEAAEGDRWFFADEARAAIFDAYIRETFRQGLRGIRWELIDIFQPWGFRLADIPIAVHLWHGAQDPWVTQAHVDFTASTIPDCTLTVWPDCGHLGFVKHWDEILRTLT
jgi:pimeloyl-ACP methyl ester carboxylesterase